MVYHNSSNIKDGDPIKIQYPYAVDESGALIYIDAVVKESRHDHTFTCPNCGKPMIPRLGEYNAHCFAHDKGKACGKESYLHKAAKEILARRFNSNDHFIISFSTKNICRESQICNHFDEQNCVFKQLKEYDLKKFYDRPAEIEYTIIQDGIEFRPDVALLSSDSKRSPIFIEVFFKHKSTEEKVTNNQCIEFRIKDFSDLRGLEIEPIKESNLIQFLNFKDIQVSSECIEEYINNECLDLDLLNSECVLPYCKQSKEYRRKTSNIRRFILYKSGKTFDTGIFEDEINEHKPSTIADVTYYPKEYTFNPSYVLAVKDQRFRNCQFCRYYNNFQDENVWCKLAKNGSRRKGTFDEQKGSYCNYFEWAEWITEFPTYKRMLEEYKEGKDYFIWAAK